MHNGKVKIGIAGCGWIVEHAHIPALKASDQAEITVLFDVNMERARELAERFQIPRFYQNYDDFLKSEAEAVVIATPNYTHADYSIRASEAGKHVLCEKPTALGTEEMGRILNASGKSGKIYMPAFVNRFRPDIKEMFQIVSDGKIGEVQSVEAGWIRRCGVPKPGTWFTSKALSGGGVLTDLGSHVIDVALLFLDPEEDSKIEMYQWSDPNRTKAASWFGQADGAEPFEDVEESVVAKVEFKDEKKLLVALSWNAAIADDCTYFFVNGTKGRLELRTLFGFSHHKLWDQDVLIMEGKDGERKEISGKTNYKNKAFELMWVYFIRQIKQGSKDTYLTFMDGLKTVDLIERIYNTKYKDSDLRKYIERWNMK